MGLDNEMVDLVKGSNKGNRKAFKQIYNLYERKLFAFIYGYTKNDALTKDITQEAYIKLWNIREALNPEYSIKSLLFKMAYNIYIDKLRRRESELKKLDGWRYKRIVDALDEDNETRNLRIEKIQNAIDTLPKRCKEIFLLCKYEGFKYSEVSEILNISTKTVQAQMIKAYKLIRKNTDIQIKNILFFMVKLPKRIISDL